MREGGLTLDRVLFYLKIMNFKNKKELTLFILMNILGAPFTWIAAYVYFQWLGLVGCLFLFWVSYKAFKYYGGHKHAKLCFNPTFTFGNRKYRLLK